MFITTIKSEQFKTKRDKIHIINESKCGVYVEFLKTYCGLEPCSLFFSDYDFAEHRELHKNSPKRSSFCKMCLKLYEKGKG